MPLSAVKYCEELFRSRRTSLLKERDASREKSQRNLTNRGEAERRVGYLGLLQPEIDFIVGLGKARADALGRAYEFDGQPLTEEIIAGIVTDVAGVLEQSAQIVFGAEQNRIELLGRRTNSTDPAASAKLGELSRHLGCGVHDTTEAIRNHLTLAMFEARKNHSPGSATVKVRELTSSVKVFHDDLEAHFDLWSQSLEPPLPDYPVRNIEKLREQRNSLARQWHGWHAFRRGLATNLHALGVDDKTIQAILRHSNIGITQNIYIKSVTESQVSAMDALSEKLGTCTNLATPASKTVN